MKRNIFYIMIEKKPGKKSYLKMSGFYFSKIEALRSPDYQRALKTGFPVSIKMKQAILDKDGFIVR